MSRPEPRPDGKGETDVRGRIFASALHHFSEKGYIAASLREITEDAHTTKPMVYYYFGSKEELYGKVVREILEETAEAIRRGLPAGVDACGERAMAFCHCYLENFLANEEGIALALREVFGLGGAPLDAFSRALSARVREPLDDILRAGMQRGEFKPDDPVVCARALTGILNAFILAHVFSGARLELESALRQAEHYLEGLRASGC